LGDNPSLRRLERGAFRGLEKLQSLHMHRCRLNALPHDIFHKLYSLQFLYLQVGALERHRKLRMTSPSWKNHTRSCVFLLLLLSC